MDVCSAFSRMPTSAFGKLLVTFLCCVPLVKAATTPQLLLQGRFGGANEQLAYADSLPVLFSWASSSMFTTFEGSVVDIKLTVVPASSQCSEFNRFRICVDQKELATKSQNPNNTVIYWGTDGLTQGLHNLSITKLNEPAYGEATLDAVTVGSNGLYLEPEAPASLESGRRILFIGDSYATGYANVATSCGADVCTSSGCLPDLNSQDSTLSWPSLTATRFSADHQLFAWAGVTLEDDIDIFARQVAGDDSSFVEDYSVWSPQIVVMAGGSNDFNAEPPTLQDWRSTYLSFLQDVTASYNGTCIILFTYPLEAMWDGNLSLNQTTYYLQYMTSLYVETQKQGMSNIFLLQIDGIDFPTTGWCSGHPNVAAHENMSDQLSTYIQAVMPAWGNTMFHRVYTTVETGV